MKYLILIILPALVLLTGCASKASSPSGGVIIDRKGVNMSQYYADLDECKTYAAEVPTAQNTAKGAAGGAVVGGLIGAVVNEHRSVEKGAGVGAVVGGSKGVVRSEHEKNRVVRNCLRGRGYRVLN